MLKGSSRDLVINIKLILNRHLTYSWALLARVYASMKSRVQTIAYIFPILVLVSALVVVFWRYFQRIRNERIVAKSLEAMERLNKDLFEEGGHRLEMVKQSDGTTQLVYRQIWSDEEIQRKKEEDGEAIVNAIGQNLLKSQSDAAKELIS